MFGTLASCAPPAVRVTAVWTAVATIRPIVPTGVDLVGTLSFSGSTGERSIRGAAAREAVPGTRGVPGTRNLKSGARHGYAEPGTRNLLGAWLPRSGCQAPLF